MGVFTLINTELVFSERKPLHGVHYKLQVSNLCPPIKPVNLLEINVFVLLIQFYLCFIYSSHHLAIC